MKIIKEGIFREDIYSEKCSRCKCEFTYSMNDIAPSIQVELDGIATMNNIEKFLKHPGIAPTPVYRRPPIVQCPQCKLDIRHIEPKNNI